MMRIMFRRRALRCALGLAALLAGCRQKGVQGCLDQLDAKRYQAAARRCGAGLGGPPGKGRQGRSRRVVRGGDRRPEARRGRGGGAGLSPRSGRLPRRGGSRPRRRRPLPAFPPLVAALQLPADLLIASEAVQEATQAGDREREERADQALYTSLFEVGDLAGARQALEMADGLIPEQDRGERARFLNNRGTVLAAERRFGLARFLGVLTFEDVDLALLYQSRHSVLTHRGQVALTEGTGTPRECLS